MAARERYSSKTLPRNHRRVSHLSFDTFSQPPRLPVAGTAAHFRHKELGVLRSMATSIYPPLPESRPRRCLILDLPPLRGLLVIPLGFVLRHCRTHLGDTAD